MAIFELSLSPKNTKKEQDRVLKKLLRRAKNTAFGNTFHFDALLKSESVAKDFQKAVPIFNYNKIYNEWWHKCIEGESDVCWPGKIKYFALSSGTSEASSKYIPITNALLSGNKTIMIKQLLGLRHYDNIPYTSIAKGWLAIGGSTELQKGAGFYAGDLSGITAKKLPSWLKGKYLFSNVKRWTKRFKHEDFFLLEKIFIPVNNCNSHWLLIVILVSEKKILCIDSIFNKPRATKYLDAAFHWFCDACKSHGKDNFINKDEWNLVSIENAPQQIGSFDCGVFTILAADRIAANASLTYNQDNIQLYRYKIAELILLNGKW
jgi:hypothetical protein